MFKEAEQLLDRIEKNLKQNPLMVEPPLAIVFPEPEPEIPTKRLPCAGLPNPPHVLRKIFAKRAGIEMPELSEHADYERAELSRSLVITEKRVPHQQHGNHVSWHAQPSTATEMTPSLQSHTIQPTTLNAEYLDYVAATKQKQMQQLKSAMLVSIQQHEQQKLNEIVHIERVLQHKLLQQQQHFAEQLQLQEQQHNTEKAKIGKQVSKHEAIFGELIQEQHMMWQQRQNYMAEMFEIMQNRQPEPQQQQQQLQNISNIVQPMSPQHQQQEPQQKVTHLAMGELDQLYLYRLQLQNQQQQQQQQQHHYQQQQQHQQQQQQHHQHQQQQHHQHQQQQQHQHQQQQLM